LNAKYRKQLEVNEENGALLVSRLCGMRIARNWGDEAPFMASLIRLRVAGISGSAGLEQEALEQGEWMVRCRWRVAGTGLRVESLWQEDADHRERGTQMRAYLQDFIGSRRRSHHGADYPAPLAYTPIDAFQEITGTWW
jgi:hypothetical protein